MKIFCSSLDIRDNLKVAFSNKNLTNIISKENCATFISGNQYNSRLTQQSFLESAASLSNNSKERSINSTERQTQRASAICNKNFTGTFQLNTVGQCQIHWEAGPQISAQVSYTTSAPNSGTVTQDWQLNKFLPICQILEIKNVLWFLLELELALVSPI